MTDEDAAPPFVAVTPDALLGPAPDRRSSDLHPSVVGRDDTRRGDRRRSAASLLRFRRRSDRQLQQYTTVLQRLALARQVAPPPPPAPREAPPVPAGRTSCPVCGTPLEADWLVRHLGLAHPQWTG